MLNTPKLVGKTSQNVSQSCLAFFLLLIGQHINNNIQNKYSTFLLWQNKET